MTNCMSRWSDIDASTRPRFLRCVSGAIAVEFAVLGPVFTMILLGIMSYGGYFWLAHSVQQLANDSARAAVAGLTATERQQLAQASINSEVQSYAMLNTKPLIASVNSQSDVTTVSIAYDASATPFWALDGIIPMPSSTITRTAAIKLAGY